MTEKTVNFKDKQGRNIVGTLLAPEVAGPFPAVIVCHGFKGSRNQKHIVAIAESIFERGLVTLRIDFTADPGESSLPFPDMTVSYELEVLDQAVGFLKSNSQVDGNRIGLAGHSLGGLVVAWYTAQHPEIKAVAPLSAVYNFLLMWRHAYGEDLTREIKEKGFAYVHSKTLKKDLKIKIGFYEDAVNFDMDKVIDNLVCPILVVAGTSDEAVTIDHAQHYYDRAFSKEKELKVIKGSDHNYTNPDHLRQVVETVSSWFAKVLG